MRNSENVLNSLVGHSSDPTYKFERLYRLLFNKIFLRLPISILPRNRATAQKAATGSP